MCEYCKKDKILTSCNFCGSAKMRIYKDGLLEVQGDEKKFILFKRIYCPRFEIDYCPMCGRKLEEE